MKQNQHTHLRNEKLTNHSTLNINGVIVPYVNNVKCLGMILDTKLRWKTHAEKRRDWYQIILVFREVISVVHNL